ncbi:hypothetical protein BC567DRAFT_213782 [Phyllosticta citribraziliensis]
MALLFPPENPLVLRFAIRWMHGGRVWSPGFRLQTCAAAPSFCASVLLCFCASASAAGRYPRCVAELCAFRGERVE